MTDTREGWLYDGITAVRHQVTVAHESGALRLVETGESIPLSELTPIGDRDTALFSRTGYEGWRLGLTGPLPPEWAAILPRQERHGGLLDRIGVAPALIGGALIAAAVVLAVAQGSAIVARLVPERWEIAFGDALTGDFGGTACTGASGQQALDALAARLSSDGRPVRVRVIDLPVVNAVALPGRRVVIFEGLIRNAQSPDEVAGVLGHEIGHVERRHVMIGLLREFGLSLVIGGADGGAVANQLLSNRYSRSAEREADDAALAALGRAQISPRPTARFFARLGKDEASFGGAARMMSYVSTHPVTADREALFERAARPGTRYTPALDPRQWQAVRTICPAGPAGEAKAT